MEFLKFKANISQIIRNMIDNQKNAKELKNKIDQLKDNKEFKIKPVTSERYLDKIEDEKIADTKEQYKSVTHVSIQADTISPSKTPNLLTKKNLSIKSRIDKAKKNITIRNNSKDTRKRIPVNQSTSNSEAKRPFTSSKK